MGERVCGDWMGWRGWRGLGPRVMRGHVLEAGFGGWVEDGRGLVESFVMFVGGYIVEVGLAN